MNKDRRREVRVHTNTVYKHFKGDIYLVLGVSEPSSQNLVKSDLLKCFEALHTETDRVIDIIGWQHNNCDETLVIYMGLCGDKRGVIYARPIEMFTSLVDKDKYPDAKQKYRFEEQPAEYYEMKIDEDTSETMGMRYRLMGLCRNHYGVDCPSDPYNGIACLSCPLRSDFCQQEFRRPLYSEGQDYVMNAHTETIKECVEKMEKGK